LTVISQLSPQLSITTQIHSVTYWRFPT